MRLPFSSTKESRALRHPRPTEVPELQTADLAARYRAARVGGDFFDFAVTPGKAHLLLLDIAGKRETALHVAAEAQDLFQKRIPELYGDPNVEDAEAVTKLLLELNKTVMAAAGGVICAPAFIGTYDETVNIFTYINAGHTPGVLKDVDGTLLLNANGLPLGLFSHSTHDSQFCALVPGGAVVLVSKGLVESKAGNEEFGMQRVCDMLAGHIFPSAEQICVQLIDAVQKHEQGTTRFGPGLHIPGFKESEPNDTTTLALMRHPMP